MPTPKSSALPEESDKFIPFRDDEYEEATYATPTEASRLRAPAQDALAYEPKRFVEDIWADNVYKDEPSPAVDKAWADLYNDFGLSQIPKWQADKMPNRTLPIPADPQYYVMQLTVFHQMHCLNTIRKALRPDYYVDPVTGDLGNIKQANLHHHLTHCIDSIRQGLMCGADISPIVWVWSNRDQRAYIDMDIVHSCRNYDRVIDWAKENRIKQHFDWSAHVHVDEAEIRDG
ncbi:hypothetical protein EIP86_007410 [Pleurotus ostreatoroseus]|nr:hypothetical protein EIP86_007410 [Pleurotus ostreatoroseus]